MNIFVYLVYKTSKAFSLPSFIEYSKYVRRTCISPLGAWQFNILFSRRQRAVKSRVSSICEFFKAASFLVQHAQGFASMLLFPSQANPCYPPDEPTGGTQKWTMSSVNCLCILLMYGWLSADCHACLMKLHDPTGCCPVLPPSINLTPNHRIIVTINLHG